MKPFQSHLSAFFICLGAMALAPFTNGETHPKLSFQVDPSDLNRESSIVDAFFRKLDFPPSFLLASSGVQQIPHALSSFENPAAPL